MSETKGEYHAGGRVTSGPQQAVAELSGYYAMIPSELVSSRNANAILLYGVIDRIAGKPDCFASLERLCEETGLSVNTVRKARLWLISEGFLEVVNQGTGHRATDYHLPFRSQRRVQAGGQTLIQTQSIPIKSCTPGISQSDNQGIEPIKRFPDKGQNPSSETFANATVSEGRTRSAKIKEIRQPDALKLHERYDSTLGRELVDEQVTLALAHKAARGYTDLHAYVNNWLRREAERPQGNGRRTGDSAPAPPRRQMDFSTGNSPPMSTEDRARVHKLLEQDREREKEKERAAAK